MEYRTSIPRTLGLAGLGVLMIAASYFSARNGVGFIQAVGWFRVPFFGLCFVAILFQPFRQGPTVVIDELGVFDRRLGVGRIPWEVRDLAALLVRESFAVFSAKLKRGAKKPSMQDSAPLAFGTHCGPCLVRKS